MINNNLDYEKNSNTTTNHLISANSVAITNATTMSNSSNDNSYFNRFDNRIAANLASVINGARFRSSSCSKTVSKSCNNMHNNTKIKKSTTTTTNSNTTGSSRNSRGCNSNNKNSNSNTLRTRLNANNIISNSSQNLNTNFGVERQYCHYNDMTTIIRQQTPTKHLQLNNVASGNRSRPCSPVFQSNRDDESNTASIGRRRPSYLFSQVNLNCNDNEKVAQTPSSDEDNSPTELNNCKRLADKPPLVKRLTMGLLRSHEESRPLVNAATPTTVANEYTTCSSPKGNESSSLSSKQAVYSYGYVNEELFEPEKFIASKFGDSCRQSLTAIPMLDTINLNDNSEFNLKKRYLRETSSANSSPKIFANRLRGNAAASGLCNSSVTNYTRNNVNSSLASSMDDDETELKDACWFQAGISRDIASEVLSSKSPGAFLVRKSSSKSGCYALTLRVPSPPGPKIVNYIILRTSRGYKINGFRKEFSSLKALITHHSVMPELLPIPLAMPRPTNMTSSRRNLDDFDTYDSLQMLLKYLRAKNLENDE